jgi:D-alanyl-D-alanine carboxypeptidase
MVPTVIVDAATGEVLHSEEATRPWYPASTTKLMTAYVALRAVQQGLIKFDTPIVVSKVAAHQPPSKVGVRAGQEITLENALKILMVKSANDIATVVAEGIGGSVPGFATMMNREAARLGMRQSHFVNPHGLHRDNHVSSARDMALLARALLLEFPEHRDLWSIGAVQLGKRRYMNTNGLIGRYPGAMGMKTGFVCASGFNLVSAAERNGRTLIAVVFGAVSAADRTLKAAQLLDQGFSGGGFSFFGGSSQHGLTLASLAGSSETHAPNRRAEICGRRGPPVSEEDTGAALAFSSSNPDRPDMLVGLSAHAGQAQNVGQRIGNTIALGPRDSFVPLEIYLGRKPGSTEVARLPGAEPLGAAKSQAFSAVPPAKAESRSASGNPLALTAPILRPGAAGRIGARPAKAGADRPSAAASLVTRGHRARVKSAASAPVDAPKTATAETPKAKAVTARSRAKIKLKADKKSKLKDLAKKKSGQAN